MGLPFKLKVLGKLTGEKERLEKMWKFLNGRKTKIAAVLMAVPVVWQGIQPILEVAGMSPEKGAVIGGAILGALGVAHKILKAFGVAAAPEE